MTRLDEGKKMKEFKWCEACRDRGMKIVIRRRDALCQWHWQLLSPELRQEVSWNDKNDPPTLKSDWYDRALKYIETAGDIFVKHEQHSESGYFINSLTTIMVVLIIVLAIYATLIFVR